MSLERPVASFVRSKRLAFGLTLAGLVLRTAPALAGDEAAAEALFVEAKRLAGTGDFAHACPKFAESNRLDRGAGTLIHLADCYEKNGQSASAWASFKDAASAAQALGRNDWQKLATTRAAALEVKLAKLTIKVPDAVDKIEVTRDGAPTSPASWGTPLPVDVGKHTVQATAPGHRPFSASVFVAKDGDRNELVVPKLELAPTARAGGDVDALPRTGGDTTSSNGSAQRTVGFVVGGLGIAGVAVGAITGLVAMGKNSDSKKACPQDGACANQDAVDASDTAKTFGTVSTIAFIGGGLAVAAGALLVFTAPSSATGTKTAKAKAVRMVPSSDGRSAGMTLLGTF